MILKQETPLHLQMEVLCGQLAFAILSLVEMVFGNRHPTHQYSYDKITILIVMVIIFSYKDNTH